MITLAVLGALAVAAIAWRLSQGPVDLAWLTTRLEEAVNDHGGPTRLAIGSVGLAWEGFHMGVDRPLDLRLTDVSVVDQAGRRRIDIPRADVSLSIYELLFGRIVLRSVTLDGPQLTLVRAADGTLSLDLGSLTETTDSGTPPGPDSSAAPDASAPISELLAELARPPGNDRSGNADALFGQIRAVRIHNARLSVVDRQLATVWSAPRAQIDLTRRAEGGIDGTGDLTLALGDQQARLTLAATLSAGASETHLRARFTPVRPRLIASVAPRLAALAALDAPGRWRGHRHARRQPDAARHAPQPAGRRRPGTDRPGRCRVHRRGAGGVRHAGRAERADLPGGPARTRGAAR